MPNLIYKVCDRDVWSAAEASGAFHGVGIDLSDGYIHLSTADQVVETVRMHFAGRNGLVLVAIDESLLGKALKYEPSRGGALFPHLYGELAMTAVLWAKPVPLGDDDLHVFPDLETGELA